MKTEVVLALAIVAVLRAPARCDFAYFDFGDPTGLGLIGDSKIVGSRLRLTMAVPDQAGRAWQSDLQNVQGGFETTFRFQITVPTGALPADGIWFILQTDGTSRDCWMGDQPALSIEFDTWNNFEGEGKDDPNDNHVSARISTWCDRVVAPGYLLGTTTDIPRLADGTVHEARIRYGDGVLTVYLDNLLAPALRVFVDLEAELPLVGGQAWVGFWAHTGSGFESHDILSWSFTESLPTPTATPKPNGIGCELDVECSSHFCRDAVCCDRECDAPNDFCALPGLEGTCVAVALPTATVTGPPTPNPTPQPNGTRCLFDAECMSGFCTDAFCCAERCAGPDQLCAVPGFEGQCIALLATPTATLSVTATDTPTATPSETASSTPIPTPTGTPPPTGTDTPPATNTPTRNYSPSVTPTSTQTINPTFVACVGNCNLDHQVTINELIQGVSIALGVLPLSSCLSFDADRNGVVVINEIILAVTNALHGCGVVPPTPRPTLTRTRTSTRVPTATPTRTRTPTPRSTTTSTATATTGAGDACPWAFTQRITDAQQACAFVGLFNEQCGGVLNVATWVSTGDVIGAVVVFENGLSVVFGGEVVTGDLATVDLWDTDPNLTNPRLTSGGMAMIRGRTVFGIALDVPPFTVDGCAFETYAGVYVGLLGEISSGGASAMDMTPAFEPERLLEAVRTRLKR